MTTISDKLTSIYNAKKDIKSAITEKGQTVGDNILEYAAAIRNIEQGSVYRNWWKVYFIDYDGTILSYQEVNNGDDFVFPNAPDHTDKELVFTGWNETSNHTSDYDPQDIYTIVIGAIYDTVGNTKFKFNAHSLTMTTGFTLTLNKIYSIDITIDWGDGTTTRSLKEGKTEYTHTYDRSYLGKDVVVEIQCGDGATYTFDKVKTGLDNIMPTNVKFGKGCTSIGDYAFRDCYSLQSITIPSSFTIINAGTFFNCYSLQSITIPSGVTSIGMGAFSGCYSLQSITIPSGFTTINGEVFGNCFSLQSISIPSSVTDVNYDNFYNCYAAIYNKHITNIYNPNSIYNNIEIESNKGFGVFVNSVTIPSSVTSIDDRAFYNCYSMQSVTIPSSVTSIGMKAFDNCYSMLSITIPSGVTSIGRQALENCYSMRSVDIPSGVTDIGSQAFNKCCSMKSVTIPSSVTSIGWRAFDKCCSLKSVTIPSSVTSIGNEFFDCYSLKSVTIPSGVWNIGIQAFQNCFSLQSVNIPSSVTNIGDSAFGNTNCILDFGNERNTVPTLESADSLGYNFYVVPDALYDTWCEATNWVTITEKIIKYSDYHK